MRKREGSRSDWERASSLTEAEIEIAAASDSEEAGMDVDWASAALEVPRPKAMINMRVDQDVLDFFKREGRGYQTKINAVLRSYVKQHRR